MRSAHATTTIYFDGSGLPPNNTGDIPATFADFASVDTPGYTVSLGAVVVGTPNINLTWGPGSGGVVEYYQNWDGRGDVAQLDFNRPIGVGSAFIDLSFAPDPGWGVLISSFDLDKFSGGATMDVNWSIFDGSGTLASGNFLSASGRQTFSPVYSRNADIGSTVTFRFTYNSGPGSYFAIDNLVFDQVPEPSSAGLMALGLGLGAAAMRRRRT